MGFIHFKKYLKAKFLSDLGPWDTYYQIGVHGVICVSLGVPKKKRFDSDCSSQLYSECHSYPLLYYTTTVLYVFYASL